MKVIVVTGTRTEARRKDVAAWLVSLEEPAWILHGDQNGVDLQVKGYAMGAGWRQATVPYPLGRGRPGGPLRNGWLLDLAELLVEHAEPGRLHEIEVHAFPAPSSRGTWSCVNQARERNLFVEVH